VECNEVQGIDHLTSARSRAKRAQQRLVSQTTAGDSEEERSSIMNRRKIMRWVVIGAIFSLMAVKSSFAIDNLRVAYPSLNTSVFALIIAQKEGYMKEEGLAPLLSKIGF
jgi:hypothetical protein